MPVLVDNQILLEFKDLRPSLSPLPVDEELELCRWLGLKGRAVQVENVSQAHLSVVALDVRSSSWQFWNKCTENLMAVFDFFKSSS